MAKKLDSLRDLFLFAGEGNPWVNREMEQGKRIHHEEGNAHAKWRGTDERTKTDCEFGLKDCLWNLGTLEFLHWLNKWTNQEMNRDGMGINRSKWRGFEFE